MKLSADTNGNVRFFSARLGLGERFDSKEIEMLSAGAIPALIPPSTIQGRNNRIIKYDISLFSTLEFYLSCTLSREAAADVLLQCVHIFRQLRQAYLDFQNLVLSLDKVYIRLEDQSLHFIYLPLLDGRRKASQPAFFKRLIRSARRSTYEQTRFLDACLAWLGRPASFTLEEFEAFIKANGTAGPAPRQAPPPEIPRQESIPYAPAFPPADQGATSRLDWEDAGGTVLLGAMPAPARRRFYLLRVQTGERREIDHSPFLVGTEAASVSYCITGNRTVSRRHAAFTIETEGCTIADQHSTNRTLLNGTPLTPLQPYPLANGDQIRMGNEDFTFVEEG